VAIALLQQPFESFRGHTATEGGHVITNVSKRSIVRTKGAQPTTTTGPQSIVREITKGSAQAFLSILGPQRLAWDFLAKKMTRRDANGRTYTYSAWSAFIQVNFYRQLNFEPITYTAPSFSRPTLPAYDLIEIDGINILIACTTIDATYTGWAYYQQSPAFGGNVRNATKRECSTNRADPGSQNMMHDVTSGAPINFDDEVSDQLHSWITGDRAGVLVTPISSQYVPGPPVLQTIQFTRI
jgi:hypothetical protein